MGTNATLITSPALLGVQTHFWIPSSFRTLDGARVTVGFRGALQIKSDTQTALPPRVPELRSLHTLLKPVLVRNSRYLRR